MQHVGVDFQRPRYFGDGNALFQPLDRAQFELPIKLPARQSHDSFSPFHGFCLLTGCLIFGGKSSPEVGSRLIAHMGLSHKPQRASIVGLGCAGALFTLQRTVDFIRANPGRQALMLAVEICSACYYVDNTLETVIGNAICADGAAAFLLADEQEANRSYPQSSTLRLLLIRSRLRRLDFNIAKGSCASCWGRRFSTWLAQ